MSRAGRSSARALPSLLTRFPLGPGWSAPEVHALTVQAGPLAIGAAGLASTGSAGAATGSAAALGPPPLERAYFELLERTSLMDALAGGRALVLRDARGSRIGLSSSALVFPVSARPERSRFARSNGVAAGPTWELACRSALAELVERDRMLRSWYGGRAPDRLPLGGGDVPEGLTALYELEAYDFPPAAAAHSGADLHVRAVFGFPRQEGAPFLYGAGAKATPAAALAAAASECLQRLAFLWGEPLPTVEPALAPTPEFHLDLFQLPARRDTVWAWLRGAHAGLAPQRSVAAPDRVRSFADLTPAHLAGRVAVARAIPAGELPLIFGAGDPAIIEGLPPALSIHPLS